MVSYHITIWEALFNTLNNLAMADTAVTAIDPMQSTLQRSVSRLLFSSGGATVEIDPVVKRMVFPRDAEAFIQQGHVGRVTREHAAIPKIRMLLSEAISVGAKEILRQQNSAYFDLGGNLFLQAHHIYLFVDRPAPKSIARVDRSLFSGRRSEVLTALLMLPPQTSLSVNELAKSARVSPSTTSQTLTELERFQWVSASGKGPGKRRELNDAGAVLDAWTNHYVQHQPAVVTHHLSMQAAGVEAAARALEELCNAADIGYAITESVAAYRYLHRPTPSDKLVCYLAAGPATQHLVEQLQAMHSLQMPQVTVTIYVDKAMVFNRRIDELTLANPIRVYQDLVRDGDAALARLFRQNYLRF